MKRAFLLIFAFSYFRASAVPLEIAYTGQLIDSGGAPITNLATYVPAGRTFPSGHVAAVRFRFYNASSGGTPITLATKLLDAANGAPLNTEYTYLPTCPPATFPDCLTITPNTNGVFNVSFFLTPADFNTLFPAAEPANGVWVETELVYVNMSSRAVVAQSTLWPTLPNNPPVTRQHFTVAPYCLKVPIDTALAYNSNGQLTIAASGITNAHIAPGGITGAGKVSGSAITSGQIAGSTSINTSGSITGGAASFSSLTVAGSSVTGGSGTAGRIPAWTSGSALGDSPLIVNGSRIGIGEPGPVGPLHVTQRLTDTTDSGGIVSGTYPVVTGAGGTPTGTTINTSKFTEAARLMANPVISSGVYNQAYVTGLRSTATRAAFNDLGRLGALNGADIHFGHTGTTSRATDNAIGLQIVPYVEGGTIANMYGIYIGTPQPGSATVGGYYGIYQGDVAAQNWFVGKVAIGTQSAAAGTKLDVGGQIRAASYGAAADVLAFDWSRGNVQHSTHTGAGLTGTQNITFTNMLEGGAYTLVLKTTRGARYNFSQTGLTFKFNPANAATTLNTDTIYTFVVAGGTAYVAWSSGFAP